MSADQDKTYVTGNQIEDYVIGDLISRGTHTLTWKASQVSVQREVVICSLRENFEGDAEMVDNFFADVRKKASVEHPLIGSVLEAVNSGGHCFYARERLNGNSLEKHHENGLSISPLHVARILRGLADAYKFIESKGVATLPLTPNDVFLDDRLHCRMVNMLVDGDCDPTIFTRDKQLIGMLFQDLLEPNQPGSTRVGSLLDFMADMSREVPLTWDQIYDLSDEVERQLTEPKKQMYIQSPTMPMKPFISAAALAKIGIAVTVLSIVVGLGYYVSTMKQVPAERIIEDLIEISAGRHPGPDGTPVKLGAYRIDAHEVTIGEYAKFLHAMDTLRGEDKTTYQHEDHPVDKTSHLPDDWAALYMAAKEGGGWSELEVDLNYPVVGVDWWDAYAYANWKDRRLPSRDEWYASGSSSDDLSKLEGTGWLPVDQAEKTKLGVYGLAGNVSEWTREKTIHPAAPSQPARYVICGASYLKPKYGARASEWVDDRSLRRKDLGFRTLKSSSQDD